MSPTPSAHDVQNTQPIILCLSTSRAPSAEIDHELRIADEAGFACIELWAPTLEACLASHPVVWLDLQMRQHGIHRLIVNGLAPLSIATGTPDEDALVNQARFLELCTHLDALGGATLILHPAAVRRGKKGGSEAGLRVLRAYADLAAPFEIDLGFEFRAASTVPTLEAAQDLVKGAARSNLRLSLSTREWCAAEEESRTLDARLSNQLALVHLDTLLSQDNALSPPSLAASTLKPPPTQSEPALTPALCKRLAATGFRGPYGLPCTPEPETSLERARAARQAALDVLTPLYEEKQEA